MKNLMFIFGILILISSSVIADYPPDWGYDYIIRSIRSELYRDSTFTSGWVYLDSLIARYVEIDSLEVTSFVGVNLDLTGWFNADSIDSNHGNITQLSGDSLDFDHLVINTTAELGVSVTSDSSASWTIPTNLITIGANTATDVDIVVAAMPGGGAPLDIIIYDDGESRVEFPTPVNVASMTSTGNVDVNGILNANEDVFADSNMSVGDTLFCDYYMGHSPMYFLSPSYFSYLSADTIGASYQVAPSFSGTDFTNTEGYWDIIAGPDSLDWAVTNNIYATTAFPLDLLIDETDTMFVFFQETVGKSDYRLLRGTGAGWSSLGTIGDAAAAVTTYKVSMCQGAGDSLFVVFGNGTSLCTSVWNGSSFSAIDTIQTACTSAGCNSAIARESDGTLHVIGNFSNAGAMGYWTGTMGSWSATDTVVTTGAAGTGSSIVLSGSDPHVFLSTTTGGTTRNLHEYYSPAGGWDSNLIWTFVSSHACMVGDAIKNAGGVIYVAANQIVGVSRVFHNSGGWAQLGGDAIPYESNLYNHPRMALNSFGNPVITLDNNPGIYVYVWTGSAWSNVSPATGDANQVVGVQFDSNDNIHIVTRNGTNNYLLYGTKQTDPGHNTGHRDGALLIRANVQNDAADIYIQTDSTIHIECDSIIIEGPPRVIDYALSTAAKITGLANGIVNTYFWSGTITHDSVTAAAVNEDIKFITAFPAHYKILEVFVDVTEAWDDGAGAMSVSTVSVGWTGAGYADLIDRQSIFTVNQIGDAVGELNYTAVQGGIRASWSANTDLYLRFGADVNLSTLTTGEMIVYVQYQVF